MKGLFDLATHGDLLGKLEWEFARLVAEPQNAFNAYNFFVTAWHLLEWKYPGNANKVERARIQAETPLLQVCEHLAVGAKHFEPNNSKLKSVSDTQRTGVWAPGVWAPGSWAGTVWASELQIALTGEARQSFGDRITVSALAEQVMTYWRNNG